MAGAPSTGGGKNMPEAGAPNIPEPPEGCQPQSLSSSINDCSLQLLCDGNRYVYAYCGNQGTGAWACQCENGKTYDQYSLTGVTGAAACSTIAAFCASGEVPETGPEECSDSNSSREASYCSVSNVCTRPFEIDGVEAGITRTRYANCQSNGSIQQCYCQIDQFGNQLQFQISGQDGTTSCDTVLALCEDPTPDLGEPVCVPQFSTGGVGYCESQMQCTQTAEVADGVFASVVDNRYMYCSSQGSAGSGRSVCNCQTNRTLTRFDVEVPTDGALCSQVTAGCDASAVELEGPITCAPASQSAGGGYCNAQVDCKQAGTVGDLELWMYGSLYTDCSLINGAWTCNCTTGTESEQVEVEADSEWDACTAAVQACPDVVDVKIGESNGGIFPPGIPVPL